MSQETTKSPGRTPQRPGKRSYIKHTDGRRGRLLGENADKRSAQPVGDRRSASRYPFVSIVNLPPPGPLPYRPKFSSVLGPQREGRSKLTLTQGIAVRSRSKTEGVTGFFPQAVLTQSTGAWTAHVQFGTSDDAGKQCVVSAVIATPAAAAILQGYLRGTSFPAVPLPAGATIIGSPITVTRE